MWHVEILSKEKSVLGLTWQGLVKREEILAANQKIDELHKEIGGGRFDLLVRMVDFSAFPQDSQKELANHQRWLLEMGMQRAAVVVGSKVITKVQLSRTAKESGHNREFQFATDEDARAFLGL